MTPSAAAVATAASTALPPCGAPRGRRAWPRGRRWHGAARSRPRSGSWPSGGPAGDPAGVCGGRPASADHGGRRRARTWPAAGQDDAHGASRTAPWWNLTLRLAAGLSIPSGTGATIASTASTARVEPVRVVVGDPGDPRVLAEPRLLAPGEPAGGRRGPLDGLVAAELAGEVGRAPGGSRSRGRGRPLAQPAGRAAAPTSSTRPSSHIRRTRRSIRASRVGRSMATPTWTVCGSTYSSCGSDGREGRPVSSTTSSARTIAAAVVGQDPGRRLGVERRASRACSAAAPTLGELAPRARARTRRRCRGTRSGRAPPGCRAPTRRPAPGSRRGPRSVGDHRARPALEVGDAWPARGRRAGRAGGAGCRGARPAGSLAVPTSIPR